MILRHTRQLRESTRRACHERRGGFTLVEILLAALIAAMVLTAVYLLLASTLQETQTTRDAIEVEDVTRSVVNKMTTDLSGTLSPLPPKSGGNSAASGGQQSSTSSGTSSSSGNPSSSGTSSSGGTPSGSGSAAPSGGTSSASAPSSGTGGSSTPSATDNATASAADYAFQGGVIGDEKKLVIYAGRVPDSLGRYGNPDDLRSDQRQIIYWLGKSSNGGLYRRERPWVTADGVRNAIEDDEEATDSALIAEEVTDLTFEYFDGTAWQTSWDGTTPGPDGVTPLGPPRAVRVTLTLQIPISKGDPVVKQVSQVIPVRSGPGTYTPPMIQPATDGGDNAVQADPNSSGSTTTGGGAAAGTPGGTPGGNNSGKTPGGTPGSTPGGNNSGKQPGGNSPGMSTNPASGRPSGGSNPGMGATPGGNPGGNSGGRQPGSGGNTMPSGGGNSGSGPRTGGSSGSSPGNNSGNNSGSNPGANNSGGRTSGGSGSRGGR